MHRQYAACQPLHRTCNSVINRTDTDTKKIVPKQAQTKSNANI